MDIARAKERLRGPMIPVITNLNADLTVDHGAIHENVRYVVDRGIVSGSGVLLAVGAGGDFPMLSLDERKAVCKTIVEAAERAGVWVTGYHYDASEAAPNAWLTGASWNWGPIIAEIVGEIRSGVYQSSIMLAGLEAGWVKLAPFGSSVSDDVRQVVLDTVEGLRDGSIEPFAGPVSDQNGNIRIPAGAIPTDIELQTLDWLVEGITGRTN